MKLRVLATHAALPANRTRCAPAAVRKANPQRDKPHAPAERPPRAPAAVRYVTRAVAPAGAGPACQGRREAGPAPQRRSPSPPLLPPSPPPGPSCSGIRTRSRHPATPRHSASAWLPTPPHTRALQSWGPRPHCPPPAPPHARRAPRARVRSAMANPFPNRQGLRRHGPSTAAHGSTRAGVAGPLAARGFCKRVDVTSAISPSFRS